MPQTDQPRGPSEQDLQFLGSLIRNGMKAQAASSPVADNEWDNMSDRLGNAAAAGISAQHEAEWTKTNLASRSRSKK